MTTPSIRALFLGSSLISEPSKYSQGYVLHYLRMRWTMLMTICQLPTRKILVRKYWPASNQMKELASSCRVWKEKHEVRKGKPLDWNINVHISESEERTKRSHGLFLIDDDITLCSQHLGDCTIVNLFAWSWLRGFHSTSVMKSWRQDIDRVLDCWIKWK